MVTEEKITDMVLARYRLGTVLVWLGVLTWLPFIVLRIAGGKPSLFLFLPVHLMGVVGGSRLRSWARKEMSVPIVKKSLLQTLGHGSIFIGVLVWVPYFYLKAFVHQPVDVMNYLPYHLTGVLGGIALLTINYFISRNNDVT
ncbi:MAG: hypothetical protein HOP27_06190 [Anaerolineales bacterium]|nr:hypothetical protein [Anaerolineales bacterium]